MRVGLKPVWAFGLAALVASLIVAAAPAVGSEDAVTASVRLCVKDDGQVRVATVCKAQEMSSLDLVLYDYQRLVNEEARQDVQRIDGLVTSAKEDIASLGLQGNATADGLDVMQLAFLVMQQTQQDAAEDLKAALEEIKALNKEKTELRNALAELRAVVARLDTDGDGLPDLEDACPTLPSSNSDGCP